MQVVFFSGEPIRDVRLRLHGFVYQVCPARAWLGRLEEGLHDEIREIGLQLGLVERKHARLAAQR